MADFSPLTRQILEGDILRCVTVTGDDRGLRTVAPTLAPSLPARQDHGQGTHGGPPGTVQSREGELRTQGRETAIGVATGLVEDVLQANQQAPVVVQARDGDRRGNRAAGYTGNVRTNPAMIMDGETAAHSVFKHHQAPG